jgi:hypothetical protein
MPTLITAGDATTGLVQTAASDGALTLQTGPAGSKLNALNASSTGVLTDKDGNSLSPIGTGQTWQDVTASRVIGTTYTNTTGKPIMVSIYTVTTGASSIVTLTVGGVAMAKQLGDTTNGGAASSISAIVPNGVTYVLSGGRTLTGGLWAELR